MARVIAVANQKGGVAKTTSTHALGIAMAERGRRILLVDLDPQASLTWACGVDPDALDVSIHDVLLKRARATDAIVELPAPPPAKDGKPGVVHLLPSTIDLAGAELHLLTKTGREYVLRKALSKVAERYDRVLIDCPPSLGILTINGLTAADEVVIPLQCESLSQRGVGQLLETIEDVRDYTQRGPRGARRHRHAVRRPHQARPRGGAAGAAGLRHQGARALRAQERQGGRGPGPGPQRAHPRPRSRSAEAYRELANQIYGRKGA
ncbi:MAG: AAA family ATPase [Acidimicrobiales bacterium]